MGEELEFQFLGWGFVKFEDDGVGVSRSSVWGGGGL